MRIGIIGYGNLGRGVECAVRKKRYPKIATYKKQKNPKPYGFGSFWHAVRDSNPRPSGP